jgi:hypothetical protein
MNSHRTGRVITEHEENFPSPKKQKLSPVHRGPEVEPSSELSVPTQPLEPQPMGWLRPSPPCGETQDALLPVAVRSTPSPSQLSRLLCWLDTGSGSWVVLMPLDRLSVGGTGCSSGSDAGAWTIAGASRGAEVTCKEDKRVRKERGLGLSFCFPLTVA